MEPTFPHRDGNGGLRPSAEGLHPLYYYCSGQMKLSIELTEANTVRGEPFEPRHRRVGVA